MESDVGRRIAAVAGQPDWEWEFTLFADDDEVNAWALPGGKVGVYTGIFPVARTEAGLATIIGHEVAHAIAHHSGERASQSTLLSVLGGSLVKAGGVVAPGSEGMLAQAFGLGANIGVLLPFSRAQESEADEIGLILMSKAGYDPHVAVRVWQRMQDIEQTRQLPPEFMSTHPSDEKRVARIRAAVPRALAYYAGGDASRPLPRLETLAKPDPAERALLESMARLDRMVARSNQSAAVAFAIATEFKSSPEQVVRFANATKLTPGETALVLAAARDTRSSARQIATDARRGRSWYGLVRDRGADPNEVAAELDYIARNAGSLR
jgi:predicted Zn-dependent protease